MALSTQEISDRLEIDDLLIRYTQAIDQKDWTLLDTCFVPDAELDYTSAGGIAGDYPKVRAWLEQAMAPFPTTVHYITNTRLLLDGDRATARTAVYNPMIFLKSDGTPHQFNVGAYYNDELVRTADGWKIAKRTEETAFMEGGLPDELVIPEG